METLEYTVIKTKTQYKEYCNELQELAETSNKTKVAKERIELLEVLIEKWDEEHNTFNDSDPIELLVYLMEENNLKAIDISRLLDVSRGLVSDILNYKKGLSREVIRKLALHFKVTQEAFNRPYELKVSQNVHLKNAKVMNTRKVMPRQKKLALVR